MPKRFYSKIRLLPLFLACGIFFAFLPTARAQYQIETWTTDKGLPQNTVNSITQTADGYLWLATLDGLVRFDGVKFKIFNKNNSPGIESNRFTRVLTDRHDTLWVSNERGSMTRFQNGVFQDFVLNGQLNRKILNSVLDKNGNLVVFSESGISQWNGEAFEPYVPIAGENNESIILWGKNGDFWYSIAKSLYRFKDGDLIDIPLPPSERNATIRNIFEDSRGRIWIGTLNGGMLLVENEKVISYETEKNLQLYDAAVVHEDREGNLWAISIKGAAIISPDGKISRLTKEQGLSDDPLSCVFEDVEGNIWLGTVLKGVNRLNRQNIEFYSMNDGRNTPTIYPIFQDRNDVIWTGGILTRYEAGRFTLITGNERRLTAVTSIDQDRSGRLWFGTWNGIFTIENNQITNFAELQDFNIQAGLQANIFDIHEARDGTMWFASQIGIYRYRKGETEPIKRFTTSDGLPSNDVKIIHEAADGTLWFGTYGGLVKYENGQFISITKENGLSSNLVRSLYEDKENVLWIGSYDGGLTRLKDGKFTRYTSNDGLFNDGVFQILEDERGNLWMSCNRGIYRVSKQQLNDFADGKIKQIESIALGKADGLLETECNGGQQPSGIRARDGKFWFPTQGGIAVINPNAVKINQFAPPVIIESALIDGENVELNKEIEIAAGKNNLEIAYTGLSFIKSEFVKFRYRLEGLQSDWVEAENRRTAYFSYLPPGEYTF